LGFGGALGSNEQRNTMIIMGVVDQNTIAEIIGHCNFEHCIVENREDLPFEITIF